MAFFAFENMLFGLKKVGPPFTDIIRKIVFDGFFESETRRRETSEMKVLLPDSGRSRSLSRAERCEKGNSIIMENKARLANVLSRAFRRPSYCLFLLALFGSLFVARIISNIRGLIIY